MQTSYFGNIKNIKHPLSISGKAPMWYTGPQFKTLAPKIEFFITYKAGELDDEGYTKEFKRLVLKPLDPRQIYTQLTSEHGPDVTLLCHERPGQFCHRRLVADWFKAELSLDIPKHS